MVYFLGFFFSTWFVFTIIWQFDPFRKKPSIVRLFNTFNILPIWTFFAPRPGMSDTHLLYRDKDGSGELSEWKEIPVFEQRKFFHFIWNPLKRNNKLIVDALSQVKSYKMIQEEKSVDEEVFQQHLTISKGYLVILSLVVSFPKCKADSVARQFIIADTTFLGGKRDFKPLLSSPYHQL